MRSRALAILSLAVLLLGMCSILQTLLPVAAAQDSTLPGRPEAIGVQLRRKLSRLQSYLTDQQWPEYASLVVELLDEQTSGLVAIEGQLQEKLYVDFAQYCQRQLSLAPPEAIAQYRQLVDSRAESLFREGMAETDETILQRVVDQMFCSSWGDDAAAALGELALTRGEYLRARRAWQMLSRDSLGLEHPDVEMTQAEVAARLALVSIRAGQSKRARAEIQQIKIHYPQAKGRWGGEEIVFADRLPQLLEAADASREVDSNHSWPTVGGNFQRTYHSRQQSEGAFVEGWKSPVNPDAASPVVLPIASERLVISQDADGVRAFTRSGGDEVFHSEGQILKEGSGTLTAYRNQVLGVTGDTLWSVDVDRDGALAYRIPLDEPGAVLTGAAVIDHSYLLLETRSEGHFARSGLVCFDLATQQIVWKRWICSANQSSHAWRSSLAASPGVVYLSTNLGAIVAVRVSDGRVLWLRTYSRSEPATSSLAGNCCMLVDDTLVIYPSDSLQLWALDPTSGEVRWTRSGIDPAASLVGATRERVLLNNDGLHILDLETGDIAASNFEFSPFGQGVVLGDVLYAPAEREIVRYDLSTGEQLPGSLNLAWSGGANLIATADCLVAVGPQEMAFFELQQPEQGNIDGQQ